MAKRFFGLLAEKPKTEPFFEKPDLLAIARRSAAAMPKGKDAAITHQAFLEAALVHANEMWETGVCSESNTVLPSKDLNPFNKH